MFILKLALQKLASRPGSTAFSVLLFAIGCSIISLIILAEKNLNSSVQRNFSEIDLVIGAKGSPLQLRCCTPIIQREISVCAKQKILPAIPW